MATVDLTTGDSDDGDDRALPPAYQAALRLADEGLSAAEIAERLEVAPESVPLLLDLAKRKLNRRIIAKQTNG